MLYNPDGERETKITSGVGITSNNQTEALALSQGLKVASVKGLCQISLIRDSMIIIQRCIKLRKQNEADIPHIFHRIRMLLNKSASYDFYHVKRENNKSTDE